MPRVRVAVTGDEWCNRAEVIEGIRANAGTGELILEVNTEGPSLRALGIIDAVMPELARAGIDIQNVYVDQWHNPVEQIPFHRFRKPGLSHFFWMSNRYRHQTPGPSIQDKIFALFVGRITTDRAAILYETWNQLRPHTVFSLMSNSTVPVNLDSTLSDWFDLDTSQAVVEWFKNVPITSITQHTVQDQYDPGINTNLELVKHYNRFAIELVCETYCKGHAFFPTEKTIRPITQCKSMLVYGPKDFLKNLREMGFRTWHNLWDESYDQLSGLPRWQAMKSVMNDIVKTQAWKWESIASIVSHNHTHLEHLIERHQPK